MRAIIRREILNYLKRPLFWIAIAIVIFGVFQQLRPYLSIHYITSENELQNDNPETVHEGEIFEGYIPADMEEHRELWENAIRKSLISDFGMSSGQALFVSLHSIQPVTLYFHTSSQQEKSASIQNRRAGMQSFGAQRHMGGTCCRI